MVFGQNRIGYALGKTLENQMIIVDQYLTNEGASIPRVVNYEILVCNTLPGFALRGENRFFLTIRAISPTMVV